MRLKLMHTQTIVQKLSALDIGFRRYQDYILHGDKHDVLESHFRDVLPGLVSRKKTFHVLDIGVGTGRLTKLVYQILDAEGLAPKLVALEPSDVAAAEFAKTLGRLTSKISFQRSSFIVGTPLDHSRFDLVLAAHVWYYFDDKEGFVQQIMSLLKAGGHAIFVATSISVLQNPLYQTILPLLRAKDDLPRTFESDGTTGFAEEIEHVLFENNIVYRRVVLPSRIVFSRSEIEEDLRLIESGSQEGGPIIKAMSFLWQYPPAALLTETGAWRQVFMECLEQAKPISLFYQDIVLYARSG